MEVLRGRADANDLSPEKYLGIIEAEPSTSEVAALAKQITVGETYFFRNIEQFQVLKDIVLPERVRARANVRHISILSAGCASGDETFSAAIVVREAIKEFGWDITITGVDVNPLLIKRARQGRYSEWALRETPPEMRRRWFISEGRDYFLDVAVRQSVRFEEKNLATDDIDLWRPDRYDIVFCRNVTMYFSLDATRLLMSRIARSLVPGGFLFLGHAETLRGISNDFHLRQTHGTFYYQRKASLADPGEHEHGVLVQRSDAVPLWKTADWVGVIQSATDRVRGLADTQSRASPDPPPRSVESRPTSHRSLIFDLIREERFREALEVVGERQVQPASDPDFGILQATLLAHAGYLVEAEQACRRLLEIDELSAAAQYVLALCREANGDPRSAMDHHNAAAYLDPTFAMPRLHLGMLARRAGDLERARRELRHAMALLGQEDPARILLFGGGFNREGLKELCRGEIAASGGTE